MAIEERITFSDPRGQRLVAVLHRHDQNEAPAAVILCHGMESNKESEKLGAGLFEGWL